VRFSDQYQPNFTYPQQQNRHSSTSFTTLSSSSSTSTTYTPSTSTTSIPTSAAEWRVNNLMKNMQNMGSPKKSPGGGTHNNALYGNNSYSGMTADAGGGTARNTRTIMTPRSEKLKQWFSDNESY
jgi:hypothetical protein